jgi:hypothetical protein
MGTMRWHVVGAWAMVGTVCAAGLVGCATIMHGSSQELSIASSPTGARVLVDGQEHGRTPLVADLKRKDKHVIRIELDGYMPYEVALARGTSGWVWGNIVFGGLIVPTLTPLPWRSMTLHVTACEVPPTTVAANCWVWS